MPLELTFRDVCTFIKKDQPDLTGATDNLLGIALICSPLVLGPTALPALGFISAKNELTKIGKTVLGAITGKQDDDFLAHQARLEAAYGLICFTAFFEALDRQLPVSAREAIALLPSEKERLARNTAGDLTGAACPGGVAVAQPEQGVASLPVLFPHPAEDFAQQERRLLALYERMAQGFLEFVGSLEYWEAAHKDERERVKQAVVKVPKAAVGCFTSQYCELAIRYQDFGVWASLHEHEATRGMVRGLSGYVKQLADLATESRTSTDVGFRKLHAIVQQIPDMMDAKQATDIAAALRSHYNARLDEAILEDRTDSVDGKPSLSFPTIRDAFVPQSYRVLRYTDKTGLLESDETWRGVPTRRDLGAFILSYLSSPYSTEAPLVILGHPGSGKSLLTKVLSGQLISDHFLPIRVQLRQVDADASVTQQIEQQISVMVHDRIDSWARFARQFVNCPPVVLLDGYDELLQASGMVFSRYLQDVRDFQKGERELGRPVRAVVTSRITLIDKANIPEGATILRLMEFDEAQRNEWVRIWNAANAQYFRESVPAVEPFKLPDPKDTEARSILALAEQPLLLLMLALYDSDRNQLRDSKGLERTVLYDSLLKRFIERERAKARDFLELPQERRDAEIERDMQRLGVAAIGMYNRRKLHIIASELEDDLRFFDLERAAHTGAGRALSQADMLLGSFFFVHKSKAQQKGEGASQYDERFAFEFLHNTFGEFLTADFILRQAFAETEALAALRGTPSLRAELQRKLDSPDGFSPAWYACLAYTPLFSRAVVVQMLSEWCEPSLKRLRRSSQDFLRELDEVVLNQIDRVLRKQEMPPLMRGNLPAPFGAHPVLGHLAIYTVNLVTLRAVLSSGGFVLDEKRIGVHADGSRPWDQLANIWRSWFALDNLYRFATILSAQRDGSKVQVTPKRFPRLGTDDAGLGMVLSVATALADEVTAGLSGILAYRAGAVGAGSLWYLERGLDAAGVDLRPQVMVKKLLEATRGPALAPEDYCARLIYEGINCSAEADRLEELGAILEVVRRHRPLFDRVVADWFGQGRWVSARPLMSVVEIVERYPAVAGELIRYTREVGIYGPLLHRDMAERLHPDWVLGVVHSQPDAGVEILRLLGCLGAKGFAFGFLEEWPGALGHPTTVARLVAEFPRAAVEIIRLLRQVRDWRRTAGVGNEWLQRITETERAAESLRNDQEMMLEILALAHQVRARDWMGKHLGPWLAGYAGPHDLLDLIRRKPKHAAELLRLARETGSHEWFRQFGERVQNAPDLCPPVFAMLENSPELGTEFLRFARETAPTFWFDWLFREWQDRTTLQPTRFSAHRLLEGSPQATVEVLRLARAAHAEGWLARFAEEVVHAVASPGGRNTLEHLPVYLLSDLRRVAHDAENRGLLVAINGALGMGSGAWAKPDPRGSIRAPEP